MEIYRTEQEQIDQLKQLWKKYGNPLLWSVLLALVLSYGWHYWQQRQQDAAARASLIFQQLSVGTDLNLVIKPQAKLLMEQYSKTPYAALAAMMVARQEVELNRLNEALEQLQWVITHGKDPALKQLAVVRAARIYVAQNQAQRALDLLAANPVEVFASYAQEVRGDALLALHQPEQARAAYAKALELVSHEENTRPILQMKYDAIPEQLETNS